MARLARRQSISVPLGVKKALAGVVITICLGVQVYVMVRSHHERWWPFLSYPMYSRSYSAGATARVWELRARTCGERPQTWKVDPQAIGFQDSHDLGELRAIATDRPTAGQSRSILSRAASAHLAPRPCALQAWERAVTVTRYGVDASALRVPRWTLRAEWYVDGPDSVRALARP